MKKITLIMLIVSLAIFSFGQSNGDFLSADEQKTTSTSDLKIYPNPARECAIIDYALPEGCEKSIIRIYNIIGEEIERIEPEDMSGKIKLNTYQYEPGIYILKMINAGHEIISKKFRVVR